MVRFDLNSGEWYGVSGLPRFVAGDLPSWLAVVIAVGAVVVAVAFKWRDSAERKAVRRLVGLGKEVAALGNDDKHAPRQLAWLNQVLADKRIDRDFRDCIRDGCDLPPEGEITASSPNRYLHQDVLETMGRLKEFHRR
ncbi:MAG: hypothetical protein HYX53_01135 [Chloroflexi bacterium]|nr:hypothetical protein [Chloroflexota bacterium]